MTLGEAVREWRRRRDIQKWSKRGFPATVDRKYWSEREYKRDASRLAASGYAQVTENPANALDAAGVSHGRRTSISGDGWGRSLDQGRAVRCFW